MRRRDSDAFFHFFINSIDLNFQYDIMKMKKEIKFKRAGFFLQTDRGNMTKI